MAAAEPIVKRMCSRSRHDNDPYTTYRHTARAVRGEGVEEDNSNEKVLSSSVLSIRQNGVRARVFVPNSVQSAEEKPK